MTFSLRHRARILVDADISSAAAAAKKHGCSAASITKWRADVMDDPELAGEYAKATESIAAMWRGEAAATIAAAVVRMRDLIPRADVEDMTVLLKIAYDLGAVLVQAESLLKKGKDATADHRRSAADEADSADGGGPRRH